MGNSIENSSNFSNKATISRKIAPLTTAVAVVTLLQGCAALAPRVIETPEGKFIDTLTGEYVASPNKVNIPESEEIIASVDQYGNLVPLQNEGNTEHLGNGEGKNNDSSVHLSPGAQGTNNLQREIPTMIELRQRARIEKERVAQQCIVEKKAANLENAKNWYNSCINNAQNNTNFSNSHQISIRADRCELEAKTTLKENDNKVIQACNQYACGIEAAMLGVTTSTGGALGFFRKNKCDDGNL